MTEQDLTMGLLRVYYGFTAVLLWLCPKSRGGAFSKVKTPQAAGRDTRTILSIVDSQIPLP